MDVKRRINKIVNSDSEKYYKYERNYKYYTSTRGLNLRDVHQLIGYNENLSSRETSIVRENIVYSTISALVSKIAEHTKARPFINTIRGNFRDIQIAKAAQHYFDVLYDRENVYQTVSNAFRDACIFERGWIYVDKDEKTIENILPWEIYIDHNEAINKRMKQIVWRKERYPVSLLPDDIKLDTSKDTVTYIRYWNIKEGIFATVIPECQYIKEEKWTKPVLPFIYIEFDDSISSTSSMSVVDNLYGLQKKLNLVLDKISEAIDKSLVNIVTMPEDSTIKAGKLTNQICQEVKYSVTPNMTSSPINVITPQPIDSFYLSIWEKFKREAYEIVGLSELSIASKKPSGLDSGKALDTLEDIEADRFQKQVNKVVRLYTDIAKLCSILYDGQILPDVKDRPDISWKQLRNISEKMSIQFSAADGLSKDPSTKLQLLQQMAQSGLLPTNRIAPLMNMPDLELGYSFAMNSYNAVQTVIADCIENGNYDIEPFIPLEELKPEIMNTCLLLKSLGKENDADIKKLLKLYKKAIDKEAEVGKAAQMDEASAQLDTISNNMDYTAEQYDMQAQQMTSIANDLQNGQIDVNKANELLQNMSNLNLAI